MLERNRARDSLLAAFAAGLLVGCGAADEPASAPTAPAPAPTPAPGPEPAPPTLAPELEQALQHLQTRGPVSPVLAAVLDRIFVADLDGAEEVPANGSQARAQFALLVLDAQMGSVVFALHHGVAAATAAHIHRGFGGLNGPILVPLDHTRRLSVGSAVLPPDQLADLQAGRLYANVHSMMFPRGEIRGQLLHIGETLFTCQLSGAEEVPPRPSSMGTGGVGVLLHAAQDSVHVEGAFMALTSPVTVAHLHAAPAGMNGGVRVPLAISGSSLSAMQAVTPEDAAALFAGGMYANVHSMMFPAGEIRCQLAQR
jgi:hypothetical protein